MLSSSTQVSIGPPDPNPHVSERDCRKDPIPPRDTRLIAWEIKRPQIQNLQPLPNNLRCAIEEGSNKETMHMAVQFCVNAVKEAMEEATINGTTSDGVLKGNNTMIEWMMRLTPAATLALYDRLRDKLPTANGWVVAFNPTLAALTGSSTNACLLGNKQQSASALFYVIPYVCKNKVHLESTLKALENAQAHVSKFPSKATDSGTAKRNVQHMFARCINDLSKSAKVSDTQVALSLLNFPMEITSDSYGYFGASYCANHVQNNLPKMILTNDCAEENQQANEEADTININCEDHSHRASGFPQVSLDSTLNTEAITHNHNTRGHKKATKKLPTGPAPFYKTIIDGQQASIPVHYPTHWFNRGKALRNITAAEYFACFEIKRLPKTTTTTTNKSLQKDPGRPENKVFRFHKTHPLHHTHGQFLRSKQRTLIVSGQSPKRPGDPPQHPGAGATKFELAEFKKERNQWLTKANAFAFHHMTLYLPQPDMFGDKLPRDLSFTWDTFCATIELMEQSPLLIDRLRLAHMFRSIDGVPSNYKMRTLLDNYRRRSATWWTEEERQEASTMFGVGARARCEDDETLEMSEIDKIYSDKTIKDTLHENRFCSDQLRTIKSMFLPTQHEDQPSNITDPPEPSSQTRASHRPTEPTDPKSFCNLDTALPQDIEEVANVISKQKFDPHSVNDDNKADTEVSHHDVTDNNNGTRPKKSPKPGAYKRNRDGQLLAPAVALDAYIQTRDLKTGQAHVVRHFADHFLRLHRFKQTHERLDFEMLNRQTESPAVLLTGDPGSGKSYVIETIQAMANLLQLGTVASASYNGMAAVNIDGSTVCRLFSVSEKGQTSKHTLPSTAIRDLQLQLDSANLCCVIIDEVSTIDSKILALISFRLQQITGNTGLPFGGLPVLFVGDFNQLGPVKKTHLATDMMRWAAKIAKLQRQAPGSAIPLPEEPQNDGEEEDLSSLTPSQRARRIYLRQRMEEAKNSRSKQAMEEKARARFQPHTLHYHGCHLFAGLLRFHLEEQVRAEDDFEHKDMVKRLSLGTAMTPSDIDRMEHISRSDLQGDEAHLWKFAPVLVSTNRERLNITREKCRIWAIEHKTYVFKWRCKDTAHVNKPNINDYNRIVAKEAFFWQFWVPNAPAHLGHNVNPSLALVNGSPVLTHSLTFSDRKQFLQVMSILEGPDIPAFGTEIEIDPPLSLNMRIKKTLDDKPMSTTRAKQLDKLKTISLTSMAEPDEIVIPFTNTMCKGGTDPDKFKYATGDVFVPIAEVSLRPIFPFELAFSVTIHKAQGRTLNRVLIDLTQHPCNKATMEFAAIFVAQSRVKQGKHIKLLKHSSTLSPFDPDTAYGYLTRLRPMHDTMALYHGCQMSSTVPNAMTWSINKALSYDQ